MPRRFQFSLRALLQTTAALALLVAFCGLSWNAKVAYAKLVLYPVVFLLLLVLLGFPAWLVASRLFRCWLGRLPPDGMADAEPIRFDRQPTSDEP